MSEEKSIFGELYDGFFGKPMPMWIGSVLLAAMSVGLFVLAQPFGASCAIVNWGQNIYGWNVDNPKILDTVDMKCAMGLITLVLGSMGAAMLSREWSLKVAPPGELVKGIIGGLFMAFGAVIGKGCTLGSFFSGIPALSAGALVFGGGLMIGVFIAVRWLLFEVERWPGISQGKSYNIGSSNNKFLQPIIGLAVITVALLFPFFFGYDVNAVDEAGALTVQALKDRVVVGFIVISVFMGIILQRSRWCIVRAMREPWMSGDSTAATAIIAGMFTGLFGIAAYKFAYGGLLPAFGGSTTVDMVFVFPNFWVRALMGSVLFGFGMTIAGGCAVGSLWRAGEGQVKLMLAVLTMTFVMPFVSRDIMGEGKALPTWLKSFDGGMDKLFLPNEIGYGWSLVLVSGVLMLWYWFAKWNDRTGKFAAM